jgi:hypothetical protein
MSGLEHHEPERPVLICRLASTNTIRVRAFVRGKYAAKAAAASNIAVLEPEIAMAFPNSEAVNDALRTILQAARHVVTHS